MKAGVRLYASLKEKKGGMEVEAATLGEAVKKIRELLEGEEIQILVNGRNAEALDPGRKLQKKDLLEAFPPVGGG